MIKIENFTYTYPGRSAPTIKGLSAEIAGGEFVLLTGRTGCGKSTVLKGINGLIPHLAGGRMEGKIAIDGLDTRQADISTLSRKVGLIFQNPDDQIFSTVVQDEVAFGPENLALPRKMIRQAIDKALKRVGLDEFRHRGTHMLSGGEKQRLAIASVLSMSPEILILDEPLAQLDPRGTTEVLKTIKGLNDNGMTVILVEHRIHEVAHLVDRIMIMERGRIVLDDEPRRALAKIDVFKELGLRVPESAEFSRAMGFKEVALDLDEIKKMINDGIKPPLGPLPGHALLETPEKEDSGTTALEMEGAWFRYDRKADFVLKDVTLSIKKGEVVSLMGNNGSGKSTLLLHFAALLKPSRGGVIILGRDTHKLKAGRLAGTVGVVFQDSTLILFNETVWQEVAFGPRMLHFGETELKQRGEEAMNAMGIAGLRDENPLALSGGQRLRVALASIFSMQPEVILLDEPTSGQDKSNSDSMLGYLYELSKKGITILFTTHDIGAAIRYSDRLLIMNDGKIIADGPPRKITREIETLKKANLRPPLSFEIGQVLGVEAFCMEDLTGRAVCSR